MQKFLVFYVSEQLSPGLTKRKSVNSWQYANKSNVTDDDDAYNDDSG